MRKHNAENEVAKREYLAFLRNAGGRSEATLDAVAAAIHRFEAFIRYKSFKTFRREQAISFKEHLASQKNDTTGKPLSKATLRSTLRALKAFFEWLCRETGYRKLVFSDAAYFNVSDNEARIATAERRRPAPSLDQVRRMVEGMPMGSVVERRDRAVVALIMLTGARDAAVASLCLKHLDIQKRTLFQDAREVKTKRAKTMTTFFFPVGEPFEEILRAWTTELYSDLAFGPDDPLFPATQITLAEDGLFRPTGLQRHHWTTASPIREIFRRAWKTVGLPYYNPHSLRQTLMRVGYDLDLSPRELKAWSQNLGHESIITSVVSYGALSLDEQGEVLALLKDGASSESETVDDLLDKLIAARRRR